MNAKNNSKFTFVRGYYNIIYQARTALLYSAQGLIASTTYNVRTQRIGQWESITKHTEINVVIIGISSIIVYVHIVSDTTGLACRTYVHSAVKRLKIVQTDRMRVLTGYVWPIKKT